MKLGERIIGTIANHYYDSDGKAKIHRVIAGRKEIITRLSAGEQAQYIAAGKERMAEIAEKYPNALLDRQEVEKDLLSLHSQMFAKPQHAIRPFHEGRHLQTVYLLGQILAGVAQDIEGKKPESERIPIDTRALAMSSISHDVARFFSGIFETLDSVHGINRVHGKVASHMLPTWFAKEDIRSVRTAQEAVSYHDYHKTPEGINNPVLELLVIADRLELVRMLFDPFYGDPKNPLRAKFEKREKEYNAKYFPQLSSLVHPVAQALYLVTVDNINALQRESKRQHAPTSFADQKMALLAAAEELGIFKKATIETQSVENEEPVLSTKE